MAEAASASIPTASADGPPSELSPSLESPRNVTLAVRLHGPLNLTALRNSVLSLSNKYSPLWNLRQARGEYGDVLPVQDFSGLPVAAREGEARRYIHRQVDRPFERKDGPPLRAILTRLSPSENILLLAMPRSLCGAGVLMTAVVGELSALYHAYVSGQPSPLPKPVKDPLAVWDQGDLTPGSSVFWKTQMENTAGALELPSDRPRAPYLRGVLGRESHMLPDALMASVREFSSAQGLSPFTTLFAAFAALLARYSGQTQFFVGASLSDLKGPAEVPSGYSTLLPLRADTSGDPSFRELAHRIRQSSVETVAHAEEPRQRADGPADLGFFEVAFVQEQAAWEKVHFSGLSVSAYELRSRSTGLDVLLHLEHHPAGILITADHDAALFDADSVQRFLGHYETLLASALSDAGASISRLAILTEPESQKLLYGWNSTAQGYLGDVPLQQLIESQVEKTPDAVAAVFRDDRLTYAELNDRANQLAAHLRSLGVTRNSLVGVCLERSIDLLIAPLAILKAGGAYLPLDTDHPDDHIAPIVEAAGLAILIGRPDLSARLPKFHGTLVLLDWEVLEAYSKENHPVAVAGSDLAYVIYTSGSTGQPKGVMIPRRALNNLLCSVRDWFHFGPRDVLLALTTIAFDIAGVDLWLPLLAGARMVMVEREATLDAHVLEETMLREGVTFLQCTPATWRLLIDFGWQGNADLQAVCTGEAMPKDLAFKLAPRVAGLWNMYGPTETTIWSTGYKFQSAADPVLIGRPVANTQAYVLDGHMAPTPIGVPGELYIGGEGLADGYLHQPALTDARFVPDPFSQGYGARLYKTGDLARFRADGNIECLGRNDDQIKLRGYRIEPEEIRAAITRHPSIRDAIAVLDTSATGDSRIIAYLIPQAGDPPAPAELRNFLRQRLPDYMIPAGFMFVDAFPLNSNGKIDRRALPAPKTPSADGAGTDAPADQIETWLRDIFCLVLGWNSIGVNDDFFDLGGHSLKAAELFREINLRFNLDLPLATLFHAPTVRSMAALIRDSGFEHMNAPIVQIQPKGSRPAVCCIGAVDGELIVFRRLAQELGQEQPLFGLQPFRLLGSVATVEQLAAAYIDELRSVGEAQPFCLVGYSFGGLVAVEMARQLQSNGIRPPIVVLIDASYPAGCRAHEPWPERLRRYRYFWDRVTNGAGLSHLAERIRYGSARIAHRATSTLGVPLSASPSDVSTLQQLASESYRIKSFDGRVCLFRAESQLEFLAGGPELGWTKVLSNLKVEEISGDHGTINTGANLKTLARKIQECLRDPAVNGLSPRA